MPIRLGAKIRRLSQAEFGEIAYEVMREAFNIHAELGRLFDEKIYQRALAARLPGALTGVPIEVAFDGFSRTYCLDLLVGDGAMFELKAVEALAPRHRGQLLNYLLLADAAHGKLMNFRTERVEHEFVNSSLHRAERMRFTVDDRRWEDVDDGCLKERMIALMRDWGAGLDIALYEAAASYFCGRAEMPFDEVEIWMPDRSIGLQMVPMAGPSIGMRISALDEAGCAAFEGHLRCFLGHARLRGIQWMNITPRTVQFATVWR